MSNAITIPPATTTFVDSWIAYSPQWWRGYWGARFGFSMMVEWDALSDAGGYAVLCGLPSRAPTDAYYWIGQDRQIFQGPNETDAGYVARLIQWLDLWLHAGSSTGILLALRGYVSPLLPKMLTVQTTGNRLYSSWDTYEDGVDPFPPGASNPSPPSHYVDHHVALVSNWQWDSSSQPYYGNWMYWRKWVVIFSPPGDDNSPWVAPTATWESTVGDTYTTAVVSDPVYGTTYQGSATPVSSATQFDWDDGTCWDWAGTAADAASLSLLCKTWKSGGVWIPWIAVTYDATMFDQSQLFTSSKLPDGHWGYWGKVAADATYGTAYVAARPASSTCSLLVGTNDGEAGEPLGIG